jgi:hypothetical protein
MTSECIQDPNGTYYKSLYQFTSDGQVLYGWQNFQDTSCTTSANTVLPSNNLGTYQNLGSQTLPDGTQGYGFRFTSEGTSYDGFFALTDNNTLCFPTNLSFRTEGRYVNPEDTSPSVDYEHCLTIHSSSNPNPDPNPNPTPDTGSATLQDIWLLRNICAPLDNGGYALWLYQFTEDSRLLYAGAVFDNENCEGDSTTSDFYEYEPPVTYSYLGETTLADGTQGHSIQLSNGTATINGYYIIDSQDRLCVSHNLEFATTGSTSTDIDYEHCMNRINDE